MRKQKGIHASIILAILGTLAVASLAAQAFTPWWSELPPGEKHDIEERMAREQATAWRAPKPKNPELMGPSIMQTDPPRPLGILENAGAPFPAAVFTARNAWQGKRDGGLVIVYAGVDGADPQQGLVIVIWEDKDGGFERAEHRPTPVKAGPVKIVKAEGNHLTLEAQNGATFTFDVQSQSFVSP